MVAGVLSACGGAQQNNNATSDQAAPVGTYSKDFAGLQKYITDRNGNAAKNDIYYSIMGAKDGVRYVLDGNSYVEIYDFSGVSTADQANKRAQEVLADIEDDGKITPIENGTQMTGVITKSGKFVLLWDATRGYDYDNKVATKELVENW